MVECASNAPKLTRSATLPFFENAMTRYVFPPAPQPSVVISGSDAVFPVHRIYCVGRNYAAHAREMGSDPNREPPFFFEKPANAIVPNDSTIPYPMRTNELHHEIELVVALAKGGSRVSVDAALDLVFGYAVGNDLTRRDLQSEARQQGRPWTTAKGFDRSAVISAIHPASVIGHPTAGRIWLNVNGELRQQGDLSELIWNVPEIIAELSTLFELAPGDLIYTGTPAGVGAVKPGDRLEGGIDGVDELVTTIAPVA
jgi:fumarylpyruvate hydrolase